MSKSSWRSNIYLTMLSYFLVSVVGDIRNLSCHRTHVTCSYTHPHTDSHGHMLEYGANRILPLDGCKSIQGHSAFGAFIRSDIRKLTLAPSDTVDRVKRFISANPLFFNDTNRIVEGWGWDHTSWPAEVFPNAVSACGFFIALRLLNTCDE